MNTKLPDPIFHGVLAGKLLAYRDEYIDLARKVSGDLRAMRVRIAREANREYLRHVRRAKQTLGSSGALYDLKRMASS